MAHTLFVNVSLTAGIFDLFQCHKDAILFSGQKESRDPRITAFIF